MNARTKVADSANAELLRDTFLRVLLSKLPSWEAYIVESMRSSKPIEVFPQGWNGPPFQIDIRGDTVTVYPLCSFGLDYISTASEEDVKQRSQLVFERPISDIGDFVAGRKLVAIKRHKWLFFKLGWNISFVQTSDVTDAIRAKASIIAWPNPNQMTSSV